MKRLPLPKRFAAGETRVAAMAGLVSMGLRAALLLGKFAFIVVLAKYTDTATVGIYALLVTISSIAIYLIGLEIHTYTGRELVAQQGDGRGAVHIQSHLTTVTGVYMLALPVVWGFTYWIDLAGKFSFPLFAGVLLLEVFGQELGRYLIMLSQPVASNLLQFARGAAWMPVPIVLLVMGIGARSPIDGILWSWLAGGAAACAFGFWRIRGYLRPRHRLTLEWLSGAFMSARHYFVVALLTQVQYYSDRFVVQYFLGESRVGVLSFYQSFANTMMTFVQTGVVTVMLPRLLLAARHDDAAEESRVRRTMFGTAIALAGAISVGLAVGMPILLRQMHRAAYEADLPIFYILLVGNLLLVAGLVVHLNLYARRRDADLMRASSAIIPLGFIANVFIVPRFGIAGAACTFVGTAVLDLSVKYWLLRRATPKKDGSVA